MDNLNDAKLISFEIDKSLSSIWEALQYSSKEIEERKKNLSDLLQNTYAEFVKSEYLEYDKYNHILIKAKSDFRKTKEMLGDFKVFITSSIERLPVKEQITTVNNLTLKLLEENKDQIEQSKTQFKYLQDLYNELGIPPNKRGEFQSDEKNEYTSGRLARINNKISELQKEKTRRIELNDVLSKSINTIAQKTEESVDEEVQEISQKKKVDSDALNRLEQTNLSLIDLNNSRKDQVRYLIRQIKDLYSLLAIDQRDWIQFSYSPTANNISLLEKELEFLESQKDERLPSLIDFSQKEINRLSEILQIPESKRPKYHGNNKVEEARYYQSAVSNLEDQVNQSSMSQSNFGPNGSPNKNYTYSSHSAQTDKNANYLDNSAQTEKSIKNMNVSPKSDKSSRFLENSPTPSKKSQYLNESPKTEIHSQFYDNSPEIPKAPRYSYYSPKTEIHSQFYDNLPDIPKVTRNSNTPKTEIHSRYFYQNSPEVSKSSTRNLSNSDQNTNNSQFLINSQEIDKHSKYSNRSKNSPVSDRSFTSALLATPPKKKTYSGVNSFSKSENEIDSKNENEIDSKNTMNSSFSPILDRKVKSPPIKGNKKEMREILLMSRDPFYTYV